MRVYSNSLCFRTMVSFIDRTPQTSIAEDEPLITFWAKVWISLPTGHKSTPVDLEGTVQVHADRSVSMVELKPKYGIIRGLVETSVLDVYRDALLQSFKDTNLATLGVQR